MPIKDKIIKNTPNELINIHAKKLSSIEKKHKQIVFGACKIFYKKGFHSTTIREIAKASKMSMGQLYHYISSKDDVLFLVHKHLQEVWREHLKYNEIELIKDPCEKFVKALRHTLDFMINNKKLLQFVYTESKHLDKKHLNAVLEMDYNDIICFWRKQLEELAKHKPIKYDLNFLSSMVSFILVFLALRGWTLKSNSMEESIESVIDFLTTALEMNEC